MNRKLLSLFAALLLLTGCGPQRPADTDAVAPAGWVGSPEPEPEPEPTPATTMAASPSVAAPTAAAPPVVVTKTVTETKTIPYQRTTVNDPNLAKGKRVVRVKGVNGTKTLKYEITLTDGRQTAKKLIGETVTKRAVTEVVAVGTKQSTCDPNYTPCVPIASDVDCAGGSGDGPAYVDGPVTVIGTDVYGLDHDDDGTGCE